jgi:hypothetical protein
MQLFEVTPIFPNNSEKLQCCSLAYYQVNVRTEELNSPEVQSAVYIKVSQGSGCPWVLVMFCFGKNSPCCCVGDAPSLRSQISAVGRSTIRLKEEREDYNKGAASGQRIMSPSHSGITFLFAKYLCIAYSIFNV